MRESESPARLLGSWGKRPRNRDTCPRPPSLLQAETGPECWLLNCSLKFSRLLCLFVFPWSRSCLAFLKQGFGLKRGAADCFCLGEKDSFWAKCLASGKGARSNRLSPFLVLGQESFLGPLFSGHFGMSSLKYFVYLSALQ